MLNVSTNLTQCSTNSCSSPMYHACRSVWNYINTQKSCSVCYTCTTKSCCPVLYTTDHHYKMKPYLRWCQMTADCTLATTRRINTAVTATPTTAELQLGVH